MKILYAGNFDLSGYTGKNRATRQKLQALTALVDELKFFSVNCKPRLFGLLVTELKCFAYILRQRPDIFISRGNIGLLSVCLCKLLKCKTFREIHADRIEEINLLNKSEIFKSVLKLIALYTLMIDRLADARIFNHPLLKDWYDATYGCGPLDFYCYNGFAQTKMQALDKKDILAKYKKSHGLSDNYRYLIFTGSASQWHGVEYLVALQGQLNQNNSDLKIICAGGRVGPEIDPQRLLINISPLDDQGSDELISIASACLLPVNNRRVSPGSPLKLYDYIKHGGFVITQEQVLGYCDEVQKYGRGVCVNFLDAAATAQRLMDLDFTATIATPIAHYSWQARMNTWLDVFKKVIV
ncbi:hypothetical protein TOI97_07635 [Denitrificimonas sp. JX-1]|uniref:Uncharacterized protein n=1 Tax=Denitrificimonas halotolerans TaxID=3098930 RepID=A0ABU5GSF2_9GAMM|nr:hypothetical protein [Denitrificimonas sp. JX-1]MDY7219437.1 hypothetical protein [Denitrificimonas sp. JX-1]